jgi:hypothetical protein
MWDILCHSSSKASFDPPGDGLFDASFTPPPSKTPDRVTVETEIFHHSARAVDTSDGGQALPPYSSTLRDRAASENSDNDWTRNNLVPVDNGSNHHLREPLGWAGPGISTDLSFMDITHDPFFQFQDSENPYQGVWEVGNL